MAVAVTSEAKEGVRHWACLAWDTYHMANEDFSSPISGGGHHHTEFTPCRGYDTRTAPESTATWAYLANM